LGRAMKGLLLGAILGLPLVASASAAVNFDYAEVAAWGYNSASWNGTGASQNNSSWSNEPPSDYSLTDVVTNTLDASSAGLSTPASSTAQAKTVAIVGGKKVITYTPVPATTTTATSAGDSNLQLTDAGHGAIYLTSNTSATVGPGTLSFSTAGGSATAYTYEYGYYFFDVTTNSKVTLGYIDTASGYYYYYNQFILYSYNTGTVADFNAINSSGGGTYVIGPGTYYIAAYNYYTDYATESGPGSTLGFNNGAYTFSVSAAVPEPSSWLLMIFGFAGLGFAGYSRNRGKVAAVFAG